MYFEVVDRPGTAPPTIGIAIRYSVRTNLMEARRLAPVQRTEVAVNNVIQEHRFEEAAAHLA
jgi:hypothetical protein